MSGCVELRTSVNPGETTFEAVRSQLSRFRQPGVQVRVSSVADQAGPWGLATWCFASSLEGLEAVRFPPGPLNRTLGRKLAPLHTWVASRWAVPSHWVETEQPSGFFVQGRLKPAWDRSMLKRRPVRSRSNQGPQPRTQAGRKVSERAARTRACNGPFVATTPLFSASSRPREKSRARPLTSVTTPPASERISAPLA